MTRALVGIAGAAALLLVWGAQPCAAQVRARTSGSSVILRPGAAPTGPARPTNPSPTEGPARAPILAASATAADAQAVLDEPRQIRDEANAYARGSAPAGGFSAGQAARAHRAPGLDHVVGVSQDALAHQPGIHAINGKSSAVFTPGGTYEIRGFGFMTAAGSVTLVAPGFPGGALALTVDSWTDERILASVPDATRGVYDTKVMLKVAPSLGIPFSTGPSGFVARRVQMDLNYNDPKLARALQITPNEVWRPDYTDLANQGMVKRTLEGGDVTCPSPGRDGFNVTLKNGWQIAAVQLYLTLPQTSDSNHDEKGMPGDTMFAGPYGIVSVSQSRIVVDWGVYRSHSSQRLNQNFNAGKLISGESDVDVPAHDACRSYYEIHISAVGPDGLAPY